MCYFHIWLVKAHGNFRAKNNYYYCIIQECRFFYGRWSGSRLGCVRSLRLYTAPQPLIVASCTKNNYFYLHYSPLVVKNPLCPSARAGDYSHAGVAGGAAPPAPPLAGGVVPFMRRTTLASVGFSTTYGVVVPFNAVNANTCDPTSQSKCNGGRFRGRFPVLTGDWTRVWVWVK